MLKAFRFVGLAIVLVGISTVSSPAFSGASGPWQSPSLSSSCDSGGPSRICAEWPLAGPADHVLICCIDAKDLGSFTGRSACKVELYEGPRPDGTDYL